MSQDGKHMQTDTHTCTHNTQQHIKKPYRSEKDQKESGKI